MLILVLESSTSSAKAMLYCPDSGVLDVQTEAYRSRSLNSDGSQDAEAVARQTLDLGKRVCAGRSVDMVSLSCTWHSLIVCDQDFNPVTPNFTWTYTAASPEAGRLRQDNSYLDDYYHRTGCMVNATYPSFKLLHLKSRDFSFKDRKILSYGAYLFHLLTGAFSESESVLSGSGLFNIHSRDYDDGILNAIGIGREQCGGIADYRDTAMLNGRGASLLGQRSGIPVIPAHPDGALNQLGDGALSPGIMTFSVGTSAAIRMSSSEAWLPSEPSTWCYRSPSSWLIGASTSGACNCVDWVRETHIPEGRSYRSLECAEVDQKNLPLFLPFLFGERCPGWDDGRKGGFFSVRNNDSPEELYHSVLEGVLFNIYQCYQILCSSYAEPRLIKLSGGILNSPYWQQMCADIFQREIECVQNEQSSLMGGAALALDLLSLIPSLEDFSTEPGSRLYPDPGKKNLYRDRFKLYLKFYSQG